MTYLSACNAAATLPFVFPSSLFDPDIETRALFRFSPPRRIIPLTPIEDVATSTSVFTEYVVSFVRMNNCVLN